MRDDEGKSRYFAALSLFMFAMLGIVLCKQFRDAFHLLGIGRLHLVCSDRALVLSRRRSRRSEESIYHHIGLAISDSCSAS